LQHARFSLYYVNIIIVHVGYYSWHCKIK